MPSAGRIGAFRTSTLIGRYHAPVQTASVTVERLPLRVRRDASLTIARFFWPGSPQRAGDVMSRVMDLDERSVSSLLASCMEEFGVRHDDLAGIFDDHYSQAAADVVPMRPPTLEQRRLIGAYFTMEYAYASAALFNPSIVPRLDQSGVPPGSIRFVMSLRAVGEGHISSIVFRTGVLDDRGSVTLDPVSPRSRRLRIVENRTFGRSSFLHKLIEAGAYSDLAWAVLERVGDTFPMTQIEKALDDVRSTLDDPAKIDGTEDAMRWLMGSNYQVHAPQDAEMSQLVIFPLSASESNGLEDMRLVLFRDDDGTKHYYGTYTAYNGSFTLPQIMEITGACSAEVHTLGGRYAANKGMALFPRRLNGWYAMITRHDGQNLYLARSDNIRFWNNAVLIQTPRFPWEFVQIGNCGSPLETDAGWLLLTHGVGPMRRYCIGATLLDLEDPTKVLGQSPQPLLLPLPGEHGGYVPNVVYSCGAMVHRGNLVIPYGISDVETGFAVIPLRDLLEMLSTQARPLRRP